MLFEIQHIVYNRSKLKPIWNTKNCESNRNIVIEVFWQTTVKECFTQNNTIFSVIIKGPSIAFIEIVKKDKLSK